MEERARRPLIASGLLFSSLAVHDLLSDFCPNRYSNSSPSYAMLRRLCLLLISQKADNGMYCLDWFLCFRKEK